MLCLRHVCDRFTNEPVGCIRTRLVCECTSCVCIMFAMEHVSFGDVQGGFTLCLRMCALPLRINAYVQSGFVDEHVRFTSCWRHVCE